MQELNGIQVKNARDYWYRMQEFTGIQVKNARVYWYTSEVKRDYWYTSEECKSLLVYETL